MTSLNMSEILIPIFHVKYTCIHSAFSLIMTKQVNPGECSANFYVDEEEKI